MNRKVLNLFFILAMILFLINYFGLIAVANAQRSHPAGQCTCGQTQWKIHDVNRPKPPVIVPAVESTPTQAGKAPSDAVVLFDGKDLTNWCTMNGDAAKWIVTKDGVMEATPGSGYIRTKQNFGNMQLHIEWAAPKKVEGSGQGRGNSGVFLMGTYEIQVLDSYQNETYSDGQASAVYGQIPPMVNACRPPGEWQTYDIIFHRPVFNCEKQLAAPARVTVIQNGVLVHDNVAIKGPTNWQQNEPYTYHRSKLPLSLQDHGNPVRYRNIWIRELPDPEERGIIRKELTPGDKLLEKYAGDYEFGKNNILKVVKDARGLTVVPPGRQSFEIFANSETMFFSKFVDVTITFQVNAAGEIEGMVYNLSGSDMKATRVK